MASNAAVVASRLTHALSQHGLRLVAGHKLARLVETKAARLPSVREVDKRKPAVGHAVPRRDCATNIAWDA